MACRKVRALVTLEYGGQTADGGNILEVMSLGARYKDQVAVTVDGERETEILEEIERALNGSK